MKDITQTIDRVDILSFLKQQLGSIRLRSLIAEIDGISLEEQRRFTLDQLGRILGKSALMELPRNISSNFDGYPRLKRVARRFWKSVKREVYIFSCPWRVEYLLARRRVMQSVDQSEPAIVGLISVSISARIGIPTTALPAVVACALLMLFELGSDAFGDHFT